jgi:hypothetical protein
MNESTLSSILGRRLLRASRAAYPLQDESDHGPLELQFDNGSYLVLCLETDGQSVRLETDPLTFHAPTEGQVVWKRIEVSDQGLVGLPVTRIEAYREGLRHSKFTSAWRVWFGSTYICYTNNDDVAAIEVSTDVGAPGWSTVCSIAQA